MKLKLKQILESTILLEGRKEDAIKKYGEENTELIEYLSNSDPSGNNKYLDWMVKRILDTVVDVDADELLRVVTDFHRLLPRIKNKDINSYSTYEELVKEVDEAKAKEEEKKVSKQAKKIFEDDTAVIYVPFTVQASCKYGKGSKWCIAGTGNPDGLNNYFDDYSKHSNFYFLINKKMEPNTKHYKYALQWKFEGGDNLTWWDAEDASHSSPPSWVTSDMMSAIKEFNPVHKKLKLSVQLNAFIESPSYDLFPKFMDMMTPEQITKVVDKIISKGDLNAEAFRKLSPHLTDNQKIDFITKYVVGNVNVSDYKSMRDNLNKEQTLTLLKFNPSILNNYDIMKTFDSDFTDDEKYKLSKELDLKQINNTDSKVLLKKWSMTEEERSRHNTTSFYVFLSTPEDFVEKFVKVDPLDPESYRTINMMKLRKQVQSDANMYGVKTSGGLLDEYVGVTTSSIPEDIIELLKRESSKI